MSMQPASAQSLSHVLWIGGSPCSGKSTISHAIAQIYVFLDYHLDAWARNHFTRRIATGDTEAQAFLQMSMNQRWVDRSVDMLVQEATTSWSRDFQLVLEDLQMLPKDNLIVAEGNFFPECVAPYLSSPHQAIWLVPTDTFCEQGRRQRWAEQARRQKRDGAYDEGSNPEQMRRNIIARDCQLARYVKQQAEALHLPIYEVDGSRSREEMTERVENHFAPYLAEYIRQLK
ncbi:hypothetical protein [Dictyobacter formicarum]|uniref:ATPase AAA n=1 Tax=Dictyobacter formicarum TaxID=2778368 RepID=A0ABQ3VFC5_9CHLR|nr:hypothetical protein [Dictyobacter formicarum]GHO84872.1 ATPase AAA [Dictyobacter formicarum]